MKTKGLTLFVFLAVHLGIQAQGKQPEILIQPYLQDATPNSIKVLWETSSGEESIVEWGTSPKLGKRSKGISFDVNFSESRIHEVKIEGLKRFTTYYYRVRTGKAVSDIHQFKTPPFGSDDRSFNMLAMSDMQIDGQHPDKFREIVNEGILPYLKKEYGDKVPDNLALVMVPGDLVSDGAKYDQWKNHFFNPAEKLFAEVPVYPVLGNHERNSTFYFKYFSLPQNGTPAYAEHWWYKDYGNTRIIGLNSNDGYRDIDSQYTWLKQVLDDAEKNEDIDFVFAQLHHPHKSELWIPGEEESTGKVVKMLEEFTTKTGKPSLHFFGHTHGYSRGQSKDHKHLWVNVASAGGAIDNWGEFEGRDYDEFTVTQDEYGFVMAEVDASPDQPKFTLKRISRGNAKVFRDNEKTDEITIYAKSRKPDRPVAMSMEGESVPVTGTMLKAREFSSPHEGAYHAASNWQVSTDKQFSKLVLDSWKQSENWYYLENRQKDDDLTDEPTRRLSPNTTYYWRVRYRDQNLNWSDWSEPQTFKTASK
ncbi:fibronectin type III domain-containing protein [Pseudozobellia thermophila]|uniref:Purple acid Phosphatase, N-terminal domain n=1 Tax=Pseudozobellia thermophila TaxID=192903 RepID=A0A1M6B5X7_9FLAO|nr:fibronectin type III domain-containing protein [Pseudozobellia thermophila]SHI44057.1 Purple acid Phosphatase, N-terminal domain [Pseudozobellia thermophila]